MIYIDLQDYHMPKAGSNVMYNRFTWNYQKICRTKGANFDYGA